MKALCFCLTAVNMCLLVSIHATADAQWDTDFRGSFERRYERTPYQRPEC